MASVACCARRECMGQLKPQIGRRVVWPGMEKIHDPAARHRFRSHVPMSRIQNEARLPTPRSGTYSAASGAPAFVGLPLVASAGSAWPGRKWSKSRPSANMRGAGTPWPRGRHCSGTLPRPHRAAADRVRPPAGSGDKGLPFALRTTRRRLCKPTIALHSDRRDTRAATWMRARTASRFLGHGLWCLARTDIRRRSGKRSRRVRAVVPGAASGCHSGR